MGRLRYVLLGLAGVALAASCNTTIPEGPPAANAPADRGECMLVESGFGSPGEVAVAAETLVSGLEVPWGIAFLPDGGLLVTERGGQLRLVEGGDLVADPVAQVPVAADGEGGLLGIALHPDFADNRSFYLYRTREGAGGASNRVERWQLAPNRRSARRQETIVDGIPAGRFHNGGRLRFGPDGMLYIGTGDARNPEAAQDPDSLAGKLLRVTPAGEIPAADPLPETRAFLTGIRNTQGFDWPHGDTLWLTDHGPSGELGRTGHDEINVAQGGDNLGWPEIYGCRSQVGLVAPVLSWQQAVPPGGAAVYTGDAIPAWQGDLLVGTLGSKHLHRVSFDANGNLAAHKRYFSGDPPGLGPAARCCHGPRWAALRHHQQLRRARPLPAKRRSHLAHRPGRGPVLMPEQPLDALLDGLGLLPGMGGLANGPADDNVVGALPKGFFNIDRALLIVGRILNGANARDHNRQALPELRPQARHLPARGDDAIAAQLQRAPGARADQIRERHVRQAQIGNVGAIEAGEGGHGQDAGLAFLLAGRAQDGVVAVNGDKRDAAPAQVPHGSTHCLRHVKQLQVEESLFAARVQPLDELKAAAAGQQLQAQLVKADGIAQCLDEPLGLGWARGV